MSKEDKVNIGRREMLTKTGVSVVAGAAATVAPGIVTAASADAPRWGMVMDVRKCIGCRACTVACKAENNVSVGRFRTVIQEKTWGEFPHTRKAFLPIICNHCEGNKEDGVPPCVKACPEYPGERATYISPTTGKKIRYRKGATYKRPDGLILIDKDLCIGCGKCLDACPYGVRSFDPFVKAGKKPSEQAADKCTFCAHLIDNGQAPACVTTCQGRARIFGDLNDPNSEVAKLVKDHNLDENRLLLEEKTDPHVYYLDPEGLMKQLYTQREEKKLDHYMDHVV